MILGGPDQTGRQARRVGFDRTGKQPADELRVRTLLAFFDAGYADRLPSSDNTGARTPISSYRRVTSVFVPQLLKAGVKEEVIHAILVDNSRRFLLRPEVGVIGHEDRRHQRESDGTRRDLSESQTQRISEPVLNRGGRNPPG